MINPEEIDFPFDNPSEQKFIQIDEEGRFLNKGVRIDDETFGAELLKSMVKDQKNRFFVRSSDQWALVEAFDDPYVAEQVSLDQKQWSLLLPYGVTIEFKLDTLGLDEWDRFHGHTDNGIPFVFSRKAQATFFDLIDEFDDESITFDSKRFAISDWLVDDLEKDKEGFWTNIYQTEETPKFDLGKPAKGLTGSLPQLKLNKSRVAVIGAGKGHDAAHLAEQGHIVTAFDISAEAITEMKQRYGHFENLSFERSDIFSDYKNWIGHFDLVFEHTMYCAITPSRRNELVDVWRKILNEQGHVLGVFFAMDKRLGPPYGGSEWELRKRFEKDWRFLYWTRWRDSLPRRQGKEVVIYMNKKP